jgi:hypothetical protein
MVVTTAGGFSIGLRYNTLVFHDRMLIMILKLWCQVSTDRSKLSNSVSYFSFCSVSSTTGLHLKYYLN